MGFDREHLPEPVGYYESRGLEFRGRRGTWRTTRCEFHGGSDSMRINTHTGAFVCMACGAKGGDVLSYEMAREGQDFISAARALGCWTDEGDKPHRTPRPTPIPPRDALGLLHFEATLVALEAGRIANGHSLNDETKRRLLLAAGRINRIVELFP